MQLSVALALGQEHAAIVSLSAIEAAHAQPVVTEEVVAHGVLVPHANVGLGRVLVGDVELEGLVPLGLGGVLTLVRLPGLSLELHSAVGIDLAKGFDVGESGAPHEGELHTGHCWFAYFDSTRMIESG